MAEVCKRKPVSGEEHNKKEQEKQEKKQKMMDKDPYDSGWVGRTNNAKSHEVTKNDNANYGTYTSGDASGGGEAGIPDIDSLEPSKLPKNMSPEKAKKIVSKVIAYIKKKNYILYTKKYKVNLAGIRTPINKNINYFNDWFVIFWWENDDLEDVKYKIYKITTVPGLKCRQGGGDANSKGAGWLVEKQFTYTIGLTHGYTCLRSTSDQVAYRSEFNSSGKLAPKTKDGKIWKDGNQNHLMLIHKSAYPKNGAAYGKSTTKRIGGWSFGCQVFARTDHFEEMLALCNKAKKKAKQSKFKYTLIKEKYIT